MDFILAFVVCVVVGIGAGALVRVRGRKTTFSHIYKHVVILVTLLLFAFFLFARLGLNPWSATIIPVVSVILIFIIVRNAVSKILETH